jgi:hypothetical protein
MMDYLTRSGVRKQIKFASDIARPDPKPVVKEIDAINAFMRRNPINKADGGRIGFEKAGQVKDVKTLPKNIRLTAPVTDFTNPKFRFDTQAGGKNFTKIFPADTDLKDVIKFRDEKLKEFGIQEGKFKKSPNPKRGKYVGVKGEKHIKFNGVTYQVAVQRMKDKKMVTEKPFYTTDLDEAKKVRDQRVAKSPPKVEKGVVKPDRKKIQEKIDKRRNIQKVKEGRTNIAYKPPKGYQVHHLLPLSLAGPDTNTRDLAVINAQMNKEMAQFDKPIKDLTEEAFLLDYNGDRKNAFKRLKEINKELNDIVKKGVKKLGPKYDGLIGFNEIVPLPDENGQIFNFKFNPVGVDFKKSIAKNIKVPEKVKNISTPELQKLVAEAPTTDLKGERGSIDRQLLTDAGKFLGRTAQASFLTPTGVAATTLGLGGLDLTTPAGRLSLGAEAAFAPELVKASIGATKGIKNRALQKGIQQALNLGLPTRLALRAARVASPIGIATLAGEGLYQAGKFSRDRIRELQSMTPEQRQQLRAEQSALAFEGARDGGLIGKKSGPPPISGPTPHGDEGLPGIFKRVKKG